MGMRTWVKLQSARARKSALDSALTRPRDIPRFGDICEILLRDPGVPVLLQRGERGRIVLQRAERVFIDDVIVAGALEQTRRYPRLEMSSVTHRRHRTYVMNSGRAHLQD